MITLWHLHKISYRLTSLVYSDYSNFCVHFHDVSAVIIVIVPDSLLLPLRILMALHTERSARN
jgi:hypothetical protein